MNPTSMKIIASVAVVLIGCTAGVCLTDDNSATGGGILTVDFGDYRIAYGNTGTEANAYEALLSFCTENGYDVTVGSDGSIRTVDGFPQPGDSRTWRLFTLASKSNNSYGWVETDDPGSVTAGPDSCISWGLCNDGDTPAPAVDATGYMFYNMGTAKRIVCLAPSCTETVCALGGEELIVGTDRYSNYPVSVEQKRSAGIIKETGSYTSPSFETIVQLEPDLVIGIASQYSHSKVIEKLREVGIAGIVTGDGEDLRSVYDNTYMVGTAMGTGLAEKVTAELQEQVEKTEKQIGSTVSTPTVMTALSSDKSPWVAGNNTYVSDIYGKTGALNSFGDSVDGWRQVGAETIVERNPQYILVISENPMDDQAYEKLLRSLPEEWKSTDAFKDGNIYVFTDSAADMLSRPSTRLAQLTELLGRIFHQDSFGELITVPHFIGDDYTDYITYSKELEVTA